jgi:tRNA pseudouridine55 synthase
VSRRARGVDHLHGVLVVDKPAGMTSAAVVAIVKRRLGARRVGHTGTLDPMATGVLPLCVGEGTKVAGHLLAEDKAYEGELELGTETDTLDREGQVTRRDPQAAAAITGEALAAAVAAMVGDRLQVPPMYSAIKHGGRRLHQLARAGVEVERSPRPVRIDRFEVRELALPRARFAVDCSKGTYVRSLVQELGRSLGCGAHLTELRRTRSGSFTLQDAIEPDEITAEVAASRLVDPARALAHLPALSVAGEALESVAHGKRLGWTEIGGQEPAPAGVVRLLTPAGALAALVMIEQGRVRYQRVFQFWHRA